MRLKPILPCPSIKEQISFYEHLGFETTYTTYRPRPYAVVNYGLLELHFYGSKKTLPNENPQMCYIEVKDVDHIYEVFTSGLKQNTGKIPRSGIPRISKLKDLADDRRFILTDTGGNTLYVGTPNAKLGIPSFFRTIESMEHAKNFEILYDLIYSKADSHSAFNMLEKFFPTNLESLQVGKLDLAKILLVALDIHIQRHNTVNSSIDDKLQSLINDCDAQDSNWQKISLQYNDIMDAE